MNIAIIDYGMGNTKSIKNAFVHIGESDVCITKSPEKIRRANALILPGVGAFRDAMINLGEYDLVSVLTDEVCGNKKPFLGICLGMQLLFDESEEGGQFPGLGWIKGRVERLPVNDVFRVPHVGWNDLIVKKDNRILAGLGHDRNFYFVHSYHAVCASDYVLGTFSYGAEFTAAVCKDNILGVQFHPEKSHVNGLLVLKNFLAFAEERQIC